MSEWPLFVKLVENLGATGLVLLVLWKLIDRWAGAFLAAQNKQADAMAQLAESVKSSQDDQREILLAVRVMAQKLDEVRAAMGRDR